MSGATGEPLVSVVMIFWNAERFLKEAIDSVRAQTWARWELLLVDDGSTDGSSAIARAYAAGAPGSVRYLEHLGHRNLGMSASRNLGAREASGEWIAFLDSDDVWMPDALAGQMAAVRQHPGMELVYGPATNWYSWEPASRGRDEMQDLEIAPGVVTNGAALAAHFVERCTATPCHGTTVMRRDTWARLGGFEESFAGMYEDQVFWFKAALGARVLVAPQSGLLYRQHDESCCSVEFRSNKHQASRLRFLRWAQQHATQVGSRDAHLRATLGQHLRIARWSTGAPATLRKTVRRLLPDPVIAWLRAYR